MIILVGFCVLFVVVMIFLSLYITEKKEPLIFYSKESENFELVERLKKLTLLKIHNGINWSSYIDKNMFKNLNLIYAPVYIINGKKLGLIHLKIYQKCFEKIKEKINLIIIDGNIIIKNKNINKILIKSEKIDLGLYLLLNKLNTNKLIKNINNNKLNNVIDYRNNDEITRSFVENNAKIILKNKTKFLFPLKKDCFGYKLNVKNNIYEIKNIFGDNIVTFLTKCKVRLIENNLIFSGNKHFEILFDFGIDEQTRMYIQMLNFEIVYPEFTDEIQRLKKLAINELNNNFHILLENFENFNSKDLKSYFKCVYMRKKYFNDYVLLLKNIFKLKVDNSVLSVNPNEFIEKDFAINYEFNGHNYTVNFSRLEKEDVRIENVGHKLGTSGNFIYGF